MTAWLARRFQWQNCVARIADVPIQWQEDGRGLFVACGNGLPIDRLDPATGRLTHALDIRPREIAGLRLSVIAVSPNGRHYLHNYSRLLTRVVRRPRQRAEHLGSGLVNLSTGEVVEGAVSWEPVQGAAPMRLTSHSH